MKLPILLRLALATGFFAHTGLAQPFTISRTNYHGWPDSFALNNGRVEAVVVPTVGRVMQFRLVGEEGVFWENRALDGHGVDTETIAWRQGDWVNFGGDKSWPALEAEWSKFTGRPGWRPPPAFDGMPAEPRVEPDAFVLVSPIDPFYGIRITRRIQLITKQPAMVVSTRYERVSGAPAKIGVWVITQLNDPVAMFAPLPTPSFFPAGYVNLGKQVPPGLRLERRLISMSRDTSNAYKIGLDADSLVWVGPRYALRIDSPRTKNGEYPDEGSNTEIYTNPDPLQYIELETLGPLVLLQAGDVIAHTNRYTLYRRTKPAAEEEARAILNRR